LNIDLIYFFPDPISVPGYLLMVQNEDFTMEDKCIASGGTSSIFRGRLLRSSAIAKISTDKIVVKVCEDVSHGTFEKKASFTYEIALMQSLQGHPNVASFVGYSEIPHHAILMKQYDQDLKRVLRFKSIEMTPFNCYKIALDVALGLQFIHQKGILHLDIKPLNILFEKSDVSFRYILEWNYY
jgi:serine/threonine protein kinase